MAQQVRLDSWQLEALQLAVAVRRQVLGDKWPAGAGYKMEYVFEKICHAVHQLRVDFLKGLGGRVHLLIIERQIFFPPEASDRIVIARFPCGPVVCPVKRNDDPVYQVQEIATGTAPHDQFFVRPWDVQAQTRELQITQPDDPPLKGYVELVKRQKPGRRPEVFIATCPKSGARRPNCETLWSQPFTDLHPYIQLQMRANMSAQTQRLQAEVSRQV